MSKSKSRKKRPPKRVLALPDLEHAKAPVLNSQTSASGAIRETEIGTSVPGTFADQQLLLDQEGFSDHEGAPPGRRVGQPSSADAEQGRPDRAVHEFHQDDIFLNIQQNLAIRQPRAAGLVWRCRLCRIRAHGSVSGRFGPQSWCATRSLLQLRHSSPDARAPPKRSSISKVCQDQR